MLGLLSIIGVMPCYRVSFSITLLLDVAFTLLLCYVMQSWLVVSYLHFGTAMCPTFKVQAVQVEWLSWPLNMGLIGCPETSVPNSSTMRNILEERRPHLHSRGSLKKVWIFKELRYLQVLVRFPSRTQVMFETVRSVYFHHIRAKQSLYRLGQSLKALGDTSF